MLSVTMMVDPESRLLTSIAEISESSDVGDEIGPISVLPSLDRDGPVELGTVDDGGIVLSGIVDALKLNVEIGELTNIELDESRFDPCVSDTVRLTGSEDIRSERALESTSEDDADTDELSNWELITLLERIDSAAVELVIKVTRLPIALVPISSDSES